MPQVNKAELERMRPIWALHREKNPPSRIVKRRSYQTANHTVVIETTSADGYVHETYLKNPRDARHHFPDNDID